MSKTVPLIGAFGSLPFVCSSRKVLTFTDLSRDNAMRWAKHEIIGKKPVLERVGPDLSSVSLKIRFDSSIGVSPLVGLHHLKNMMENGLHKSLVIGGEYLGRYVIESVSEDRKYHTGAGVCIVAEATLTLKEWAGKRGTTWETQVARLSPFMKKATGLKL